MHDVTRDEVEEATDAICQEPMLDLNPATYQTFLLNMMITLSATVSSDTAIRAAYHHGIRLGLAIAKARSEKISTATVN